MSTTVEAPEPRNIAQEGRETLQSQIQLAPQQFAAESQFAPQYAQLYQDILGRGLLGGNYRSGMSLTDIYGQAAPALGNIQSQSNTQQRLADIGDVEQYGQRAVQAFNQANPELSAIRSQISQSASSGFTPRSISMSPIEAVTNQFSASPYERVTAGPNAAAEAYNQRAISDLALGGRLGAQESRDLTNDVLARFNRAGRINDPSAIAGVALGLDQAQQGRLAQRQAAAAQGASITQGQNALGLQAGMANQGAGLQNTGFNLQALLANQQARQQANLANQDYSYRSQMANQQADMAAEQLRQQKLMQAAGFLQSSQIDPFQAILGRSGSLGAAMGGAQQAGAGAGYTGTGMFNPFNSYAGNLYGQNYATEYDAAQQSAANVSNLFGAGIGAAGLLGGSWLQNR